MDIQLNSASQSKLEQILGYLYTRYDLEELRPEELIDALLDLGHDLIISEDTDIPVARDRLVDYCSRKVGLRVDEEEVFHEEMDYRG